MSRTVFFSRGYFTLALSCDRFFCHLVLLRDSSRIARLSIDRRQPDYHTYYVIRTLSACDEPDEASCKLVLRATRYGLSPNYRWARERVHQDMPSARICNVGLGLPQTKNPTTRQNCLNTEIIISKDTIISHC